MTPRFAFQNIVFLAIIVILLYSCRDASRNGDPQVISDTDSLKLLNGPDISQLSFLLRVYTHVFGTLPPNQYSVMTMEEGYHVYLPVKRTKSHYPDLKILDVLFESTIFANAGKDSGRVNLEYIRNGKLFATHMTSADWYSTLEDPLKEMNVQQKINTMAGGCQFADSAGAGLLHDTIAFVFKVPYKILGNHKLMEHKTIYIRYYIDNVMLHHQQENLHHLTCHYYTPGFGCYVTTRRLRNNDLYNGVVDITYKNIEPRPLCSSHASVSMSIP